MGLGAIDLNLLVALEALLEEKNVTHAGVRLSTSQSAMSGSLARLRRHFNDELLVRVGREYELTPLAERLLPVVQSSLHKAEEALSLTRHFDPSRSRQRFSVVMSDYVMTVFVEPLLRAIAQEAPGIRIDFHPIVIGQLETETHLRCHDLMIVPLSARIIPLSRQLRSSRTLPGHGARRIRSRAAASSFSGFFFSSRGRCERNQSINGSMSSGRSRSGGMWIGKTRTR